MLDTWQRKIGFYERDARAERFRVLTFTTAGPKRVDNILECAASLAREPRRRFQTGGRGYHSRLVQV